MLWDAEKCWSTDGCRSGVPKLSASSASFTLRPLGSHQKKSKKSSQQVWTISKNGEPPFPLFYNNFHHFWNLKIDVLLQLLRVCEWGRLTKSLSKISLKSSSKQTDHEKSISLDQNLILRWRCFAWSNFLLGQKFMVVEFEFIIRSEICRGQIQIWTRFHNLQRQALTQFIKLYQYMT